jgi:hypothetical protein
MRRDIEPGLSRWYALNGAGEITGTTWMEESGSAKPIMLTNTFSVGEEATAVHTWGIQKRDQVIRRRWWRKHDGFSMTSGARQTGARLGRWGPLPAGRYEGMAAALA